MTTDNGLANLSSASDHGRTFHNPVRTYGAKEVLHRHGSVTVYRQPNALRNAWQLTASDYAV